MKLTVVLPFYNEEALLPRLPGVVARIRAALEGHEVRLLAVDDGSTDGTRRGLDAIPELETLAHETNRGVGAAMTSGLSAATGEAALVRRFPIPGHIASAARTVRLADLNRPGAAGSITSPIARACAGFRARQTGEGMSDSNEKSL